MTVAEDDFETLFQETRAQLLAYFMRRTSQADAADLLSETYLIAWRRRTDLPGGDERRLWLYGVARRLLAQHHRTTIRSTTIEVASHAQAVADAGRDAHQMMVVRAVLAELSSVDRDLLTLTSWERLTTAEAARVVGITAGAARVRLHRARTRMERDERLRDLLDRSHQEDSRTRSVPKLRPVQPSCDSLTLS
ncbi:MAG TPA: sigma-70 family RNA polymerase sigma factor [Nocardioidaceae bacterium]|nr:sigma-70 family RNA polymerase sigma factor [Nocardioidaceae bacterium]